MLSACNGCPLTLVVVLTALTLLVPSFDCRLAATADNRLLDAADLGDMLAADSAGAGRGSSRIGQPRRPDSFRTIDELNQYMAEMRQYYSMLGRPR